MITNIKLLWFADQCKSLSGAGVWIRNFKGPREGMVINDKTGSVCNPLHVRIRMFHQNTTNCRDLMHQSFVTTALPPTGKGGNYAFQYPAMSPTPREQTGGQNFALCPALRNRKSPWGKDPNFKSLSFPLH